MKKKLGVMLGTIAMAGTMLATIGLSGCGVQIYEFVMPENGFNTNKHVTIMFYNTMGQTLRGVLEKGIEDFEKLYPNITVKYDASFGDYDTLRDQLSTEVQNGKQPNVTFCYPDHAALYNISGVVLPLNGFLPDGEYKDMTVTNSKGTEPLGLSQAQADDYINAYYREGYEAFDGEEMYELPFAKSTEVLYYNKTFFATNSASFSDITDASGTPIVGSDGTLQDNMTWDNIFAICEKIKGTPIWDEGRTKLDHYEGGIREDCIPLGIDSEANLFITLCEQSDSKYTSATGDHFLFNNQKNKDFVTKFKNWYQDGFYTTETINKSYTSNLFKEQKSYLSIGSSAGATYQAPDLKDGKSDFEVGIASIPQMNPENPKAISQGPSVLIFKNKDPQKVLASWLLVKFLTTDLQYQALYSMSSGYIPVIKSVFENPVYTQFLANADGTKTNIAALSASTCKRLLDDDAFYVSPAFAGSATARKEVGILMVAAITGTKTIDKAFSDAITNCEYFIG